MSDASVVKLLQPGSFADPLTEVLRNGARALLAITSVKVVEKRASEEVALVRPPWVEVWLDRRRSTAV